MQANYLSICPIFIYTCCNKSDLTDIVFSYILPRTGYAKIWVIGDKDNEAEVECGYLDAGEIKEYIINKYPDIVENSNHGDIVEHSPSAGYRCSGRYMIVKNPHFSIIHPSGDYDDGSPSNIFNAITEFSIDYWNDDKLVLAYPDRSFESYWHSSPHSYQVSVSDNLADIVTNIIKKGNSIYFTYLGNTYKILGSCDGDKHYNFKKYSPYETLKKITNIRCTGDKYTARSEVWYDSEDP